MRLVFAFLIAAMLVMGVALGMEWWLSRGADQSEGSEPLTARNPTAESGAERRWRAEIAYFESPLVERPRPPPMRRGERAGNWCHREGTICDPPFPRPGNQPYTSCQGELPLVRLPPDYPTGAQAGTVSLTFDVGDGGRPESLRVMAVRGPNGDSLDSAAADAMARAVREAVRRWLYLPGQPLSFLSLIHI